MQPAQGIRPASTYHQYSSNWGGLVKCLVRNPAGSCSGINSTIAGISHVRASWRAGVAVATQNGSQTALTFIGIGGYGTSDLMAVGVGVTVAPGGAPQQYGWWEMAPGPVVPVTLAPIPTIHPFDAIAASIDFEGTRSGGEQLWGFALSDGSTNSTWNGTELCAPGNCTPSSFDSADWIEGAPATAAGSTVLPAFQQFNFLAEYARNGSSSWSNPDYGIVVYLQDPTVSTGDLVLPTGIIYGGYGGDQFWVSYLVDTLDPIFAGRCCSISGGARSPGELLNATVKLTVTDGFAGSGVGRLSLGLELYTSTQSCIDPLDANTGFPGITGTSIYDTSLRVCSNLTSGVYAVQYILYFDPTGVLDGDPGSLFLETSGGVFGASVTVDAGTALPPSFLPTSGQVDEGGHLWIAARLVPAGNVTLPLEFDFLGAPAGCQGPYKTSTWNISIVCTPQLSGNFTVTTEVWTGALVSILSATSARLTVFPPVEVQLAVNSSRIEFGGSFTVTATTSGGDGADVYNWSGLPIGCVNVDGPQLTCTPALFGNYTIGVNVSDGSGAPPGVAVVSVEIALPLVVILVDKYSGIPEGFATQLIGGAAGGFAPYNFSWTGLPGGCLSVDTPRLNCTPTQAGHFRIGLVVRDSFGASNVSYWSLNVSGGARGAASGLGVPILLALIIVAIGAGATIAVVLWRSRRARETGPEAYPGPVEDEGESPPSPQGP